MTARAFVGLGSNLEREVRIRQAVNALRARVGEIELSPVYDSEAVGFDGNNFLNLVAAFDSELEVGEVVTIFS